MDNLERAELLAAKWSIEALGAEAECAVEIETAINEAEARGRKAGLEASFDAVATRRGLNSKDSYATAVEDCLSRIQRLAEEKESVSATAQLAPGPCSGHTAYTPGCYLCSLKEKA